AVPWQTAFVALAELFPRVTDVVLERNPALVGTQSDAPQRPPAIATVTSTAALSPTAQPAPTESATGDDPRADGTTPAPHGFDAAIEPVRRRMERVKLREEFVRGLLREGEVLDPHEVALRWAGMPNKNERAATGEVLDALSDAGYLRREGERYHVVRGPD
ncbi:MAG TPA: hypothetical protein VK665_02855, partial [Candidatus Elarobacter sp.]|nr:hypothetical protein [Candidatus Elarobacter sp.]